MWVPGLGEFFFEKNMLGDVTGVYNSAGVKVGEYKYDAWGNILSQTNHPALDANPFRYRGYYYDSETGLYYLQSRYYDPSTGRFINADDPENLFITAGMHGGTNLFAYCLNNPVMFTDSTGTSPEWWHWAVSGLLVVGGIVLIATGVGGPLGGALLSAGVSSIVGGYINEANGGSFNAGWTGGLIAGGLGGLGAGAGGWLMNAAALPGVGGVQMLSLLGLGLGVSFAGGFAGSYYGQMATNGIDGTPFNRQKALENAAVYGSLNMIAGYASGMGLVLHQEGYRILTTVFTMTFEAGYQGVSFGMGKFIDWVNGVNYRYAIPRQIYMLL